MALFKDSYPEVSPIITNVVYAFLIKLLSISFKRLMYRNMLNRKPGYIQTRSLKFTRSYFFLAIGGYINVRFKAATELAGNG